MQIINPETFARKDEWKKAFAEGNPKHVVIDNFLNPDIADQLYAKFPTVDSLKVKRRSMNEDKVEDYHFERWDQVFTDVRNAIRSEELATWLSDVTGIEGLMTPDDALGTGLHQGGQGSYVDVHIDVNYDPKLNLWRRVNLLIYLNKNWKDEYGGHLEVWDPEMKTMLHKVAPSHNRAFIFQTDENAPHGYAPINVPEGESRKSFYSYFFTEPGEGFKYSDSRFISRPTEPWRRRQATALKEFVKIRAKRVLNSLGVKSLDFQDKNRFS